MRTIFAGALALAGAAAFAAPAGAQLLPNFTPFSVEARAGIAFPSGDLGEAAESGLSLGGAVTFHLPFIGIYAGYSRAEFTANEIVQRDQGDGTYTDQGFEAGVRLGIPTPMVPIDPWIKGGLVYHNIEGSGFEAGSDDNFKGDKGWGFEVGAGLGFGVGPKISVVPGVTYTSYTFEADSEGDDVEVNFIKAEIGVRVRI